MAAQSNKNQNYVDHYLSVGKVYPSVFALKMLLSRSPRHSFKKEQITGKSIIDIGFGDGRDLVLFTDLDMRVSGVEPSPDVVAHTKAKFQAAGKNLDLRQGTNRNTGFNPGTFDFVFSASSLCYLEDENHRMSETLKNTYDLLAPGGHLLCTLTKSDAHIAKNATPLDRNRLIVKDEFYGFRNGQLYHVYNTEDEVIADLKQAGFSNIIVSQYNADWFGTAHNCFMVIAQKPESRS